MSAMDITRVRDELTKIMKAFRQRAEISHAYNDVYATPQGQLVLHDLMRRGGIFETPVEPGDSRFFEGRRSLALEIVQELRWSESEMIALARATTKEDMDRLVE